MLFAAFTLGLAPGGGKRTPFTISFHLQGEENEGSFVFPDPQSEGLYFRKSPELTHEHLTAFSPFLADDGVTYGAVFVLNAQGVNRFSTLAATQRGRLLRAVVNGVPVDYLEIDDIGPDQSIVIWRGISEKAIQLFEKKLTRVPMAQ